MSLYIGLMSGTSADAIDAAVIDFSGKKPRLLASHSHPIPDALRHAVFKLALSDADEINTAQQLDSQYGTLFGQAVLELCHQANLPATSMTAIGSHGQTIRHTPPKQGQLGHSLQIGDPNLIAEITGITTVADFRRRDMAAGGHGAPLAPAFHSAQFRSNTVDRVIINTGGIANISILPSDPQRDVVGFDTGPANGLMDSWYQKHQGMAYDSEGRWALSGKPDKTLLAQLLSHPYFALPAPKSTGREDFNIEWLILQLRNFEQLSNADVQATLLQLTVESIGKDIDQHAPAANTEIYICGGGAHNKALCTALETRLAPRPVKTTHDLGLPPDWVEAAAFAWLAKQTLEQLPGNLPSVTGARSPVILGGIYQV